MLRQLRQIADEHCASFRSEGFGRFFAMVREELGDDYFDTVEQHLRELELKRGVLESAELGKGGKGTGYLFHESWPAPSWKQRLLGGNQPPSWSFELHPRDEAGFRALAEIKARGLAPAADALAQSAGQRPELLRDAPPRARVLPRLPEPARTPTGERRAYVHARTRPARPGRLALGARGIYDVCLSLHIEDRVVGNHLNADGKSLVIDHRRRPGWKIDPLAEPWPARSS